MLTVIYSVLDKSTSRVSKPFSGVDDVCNFCELMERRIQACCYDSGFDSRLTRSQPVIFFSAYSHIHAVSAQRLYAIVCVNISAHLKNKHWQPHRWTHDTTARTHLGQPLKTKCGCPSGREIQNSRIRSYSPKERCTTSLKRAQKKQQQSFSVSTC